jgi:hypothetical protein
VTVSVGRAGFVIDITFVADGLKRLEILREKTPKLYGDRLRQPTYARH